MAQHATQGAAPADAPSPKPRGKRKQVTEPKGRRKGQPEADADAVSLLSNPEAFEALSEEEQLDVIERARDAAVIDKGVAEIHSTLAGLGDRLIPHVEGLLAKLGIKGALPIRQVTVELSDKHKAPAVYHPRDERLAVEHDRIHVKLPNHVRYVGTRGSSVAQVVYHLIPAILRAIPGPGLSDEDQTTVMTKLGFRGRSKPKEAGFAAPTATRYFVDEPNMGWRTASEGKLVAFCDKVAGTRVQPYDAARDRLRSQSKSGKGESGGYRIFACTEHPKGVVRMGKTFRGAPPICGECFAEQFGKVLAGVLKPGDALQWVRENAVMPAWSAVPSKGGKPIAAKVAEAPETLSDLVDDPRPSA